MKKSFFILVNCAVLMMSFIFAGSLGGAQGQGEKQEWYASGASWSYDSFGYTRKEAVTDVSVGTSFPALYLDNLSSSSCSPAAGTNLLQYYDGVYADLVPDATPYKSGTSSYTKTSTKAEAVADNLYTRMKTNQGSAGTYLSDYKAGLTSYVNSRGLKIAFGNVMGFYGLNTSEYVTGIKQGKPISLAVKNVQYIDSSCFSDSSGQVKLSIQNLSVAHMLIGYGYVKYNYYRNETVGKWSPVWYNPFRYVNVTEEVMFRTDEYLKVSFGDASLGYLNLNRSTITDAFTSPITK